jgi:hypothetical protein
MTWQIILGIVLVGLAGIVASVSPFVISWLRAQKWVQQLHLEELISAVIPQVVEWVEWWAAHWNDANGAAPKGGVKMEKALELLKTYVPAAAKIPDEILKLKIETALTQSKEGGKE